MYNKIYTPEDWGRVNQENKDIMYDFLEEYRQQKKKPSTLKQYENDIRIIMTLIYKICGNKSILALNKKDFRKISLHLSEDLKMSNARVNRIMSCCRSMLTYCEDDDDYKYDVNAAKKVKGLPKERVRTNEDDFFLSFDQIIRLRDELIKRGDLQRAVLLMLSFDSGARRNEIAQVLKHGLADGNKTNVVVGKRGKSFPLVYLDDTRELIKQYLEQRGEDDIDSLWVVGSGESKRQASYELLYSWVVDMSGVLSEIEGKKYNIFPHAFRHSRAECLVRGGDTRILDENGEPKKFSLDQVQKLLHHSDVNTTQGYIKDDSENEIDEMFGF